MNEFLSISGRVAIFCAVVNPLLWLLLFLPKWRHGQELAVFGLLGVIFLLSVAGFVGGFLAAQVPGKSGRYWFAANIALGVLASVYLTGFFSS